MQKEEVGAQLATLGVQTQRLAYIERPWAGDGWRIRRQPIGRSGNPKSDERRTRIRKTIIEHGNESGEWEASFNKRGKQESYRPERRHLWSPKPLRSVLSCGGSKPCGMLGLGRSELNTVPNERKPSEVPTV